MNLPEFLRAVDAATAKLTPEQLAGCIHQQARRLPEEDRAAFLRSLQTGQPEEVAVEPAVPDIAALLDSLRRIAAGELCLTGELNEAYDDWYGDEEEYLIEDPHDIAGTVRQAMDAVHQYVDSEAYDDALRIGQMLLELSITVGGEYLDYSDEPFGIDDLDRYDMLPDYEALLRRLYVDMLTAAYFHCPGEERCTRIFELFDSYRRQNALKLEEVLAKSSRELPDMSGFLTQWTDYLGEKTGQTADRLIAEAVRLSGNGKAWHTAARRFANTHPGLYEQLLRENPNALEDHRLLSIGQEALRAIPPDLQLRSRVALLTAEYALRLDDRSEAERCWLEALRSEPNATNYLRFSVESRDIPRALEAARGICGQYHADGQSSGEAYGYDRAENAPFEMNRAIRCSLAFLERDFDYVQKRGMAVKQGLGWSSTFTNAGLALFLLYLYQGETLDKGMYWLCARAALDMGFDAERYCDGLVQKAEEGTEECFWRVFHVWRAHHGCGEQEQAELLLEMERLVDLRLDGIMSANRRNYYAECAAYVAGLAEVKASRGEASGKQEVLQAYKARYSRRRAFHEELRRFGMT